MPQHSIRRSRGCITCRRRKIRCDQHQPTCQNCAFSGITCDGYEEPTTFINDDPRLRTANLANRTRSKPRKSSPSAESSSSSRRSSRVLVPSSPRPHSTSSASQSPTRLLPENIPFDAFGHNEQHFRAFIIDNFAIGTPGDGKGYSYLRLGLENQDANALSSVAVNCLAKVLYGHYHKSQMIMSEALAKYNEILRRIRDECYRLPQELKRRSELLLSVLSVLYIETILSDTDQYWCAHCRGLGSLVAQYSPEVFSVMPNLMIFMGCRAYLIGAAIKTKRTTFLMEEKWKTIPWSGYPKITVMKLWDLIGELTNLQQELQGATGLNQFVRVRNLMQQLINWRWNWLYEHGNRVVLVPASSFDDDFQEDSQDVATLFSTNHVYSFDTYMQAIEIAIYNGLMAVFLSILEEFFPQFNPQTTIADLDYSAPIGHALLRPVPPSILPVPDPLNMTISSLISEMLSTFDYQISIIKKAHAYSFNAKFALCLAFRALPEGSPQIAQIQSVADRICDTVRLPNCKNYVSYNHIIRKYPEMYPPNFDLDV